MEKILFIVSKKDYQFTRINNSTFSNRFTTTGGTLSAKKRRSSTMTWLRSSKRLILKLTQSGDGVRRKDENRLHRAQQIFKLRPILLYHKSMCIITLQMQRVRKEMRQMQIMKVKLNRPIPTGCLSTPSLLRLQPNTKDLMEHRLQSILASNLMQ